MQHILNPIKKNFINFFGWKTNRKLIILESDDWGSIRMHSQAALDIILKNNDNLQNNLFVMNDGIERKEDLEYLFEILSKHSDYKGNSAVITAMTLTANPDLDFIRNNHEYKSELISTTYENYGEHGLLDLWKQCGIQENLFHPEFHGREHLYAQRYFKRLLDVKDVEFLAFENHSILGVSSKNMTRSNNFMAAFEGHSDEDNAIIQTNTVLGITEFQNLFDFKTSSFCPSQSIYGYDLHETLKKCGIVTIQAGQHFTPLFSDQKILLKKIDKKWGDRTSNGLIYTRRNCTFETYKGKSIDHIDKCLSEIKIAFRWNKPAIINTHRINYTSRINSKVRDFTLVELNKLLGKILKTWPDVEFINSAELAQIMHKSKEN